MADYEQLYEERTSKFSELVNEAEEKEAALMVAALWEERDYFDHNIDDDLALLLFAEKGNYIAVSQLLDLGADPSTYDNSAIKLAAQNGHTDVVLALAEDPRVDPVEALEYVEVDKRDPLKLAIIKQLSKQGDDQQLGVLLDDPAFRIDGIMDVLRPHHKKKYSKKLFSEAARAFRPVRSQIPPDVVREIVLHAYDIPAMTLYEMMSVIEPAMKK